MARIPIIILNWNGKDDTVECVESLLENWHPSFEIFLFDNMSEGDDFSLFRLLWENIPHIHIYQNEANLGFAKAHNKAFQHLNTLRPNAPYYLLLNNDTTIHPEFLPQMWTFAKTESADIVATQMRQYYHPESIDNTGHFMLNTGEIIPLGYGQSIHDFSPPDSPVGSCAGATLYKATMIEEIGGFDPFFSTGYEDAEFGLRAVLLGYSCVYCPNAIVYHKGGQSLKRVMNEAYLSSVQRNIFYTYFKLMPLSVILWNMPSFVFKYSMVLLIDILLGRWRYLRIMSSAIWQCLTTFRSHIWRARQSFHAKNDLALSSYTIQRKMTFFLWFDIQRFFRLFASKSSAS